MSRREQPATIGEFYVYKRKGLVYRAVAQQPTCFTGALAESVASPGAPGFEVAWGDCFCGSRDKAPTLAEMQAMADTFDLRASRGEIELQ